MSSIADIIDAVREFKRQVENYLKRDDHQLDFIVDQQRKVINFYEKLLEHGFTKEEIVNRKIESIKGSL
ncbi:MAG: hypothetical protein LBH46_04375 [Rickettsiales bacterium]|jgi:hypothetical protein|nr:hypothetical protein [Rickettsiales bacterium]